MMVWWLRRRRAPTTRRPRCQRRRHGRVSSSIAAEPTPDGPRPPVVPAARPASCSLASLVIALGARADRVRAGPPVTGDEVTNLPSGVEEHHARPSTPCRSPSRPTSIVDLADGYEGRLIIDGIALPTIRQDEIGTIDVEPGEQVDVPPGVVFEPGNATLTFTPGDEQADRQLRRRRAHREGHLLEDHRGRGRARSYTWTFSRLTARLRRSARRSRGAGRRRLRR